MLKGIAASSGVVVSKVFKLQPPVLDIKKVDANADEELAKLQSALEKTRSDIEAIKVRAKGKLSDEEIAIFDAHLMVTNDPDFIGQIEDTIKNDNVNADYAVEQIASGFIAMFENMDDAYFKERAADIKDVTFRLKCHILGEIIPDLTAIDEEVVIVAHDLTPSDTAQLDRQFVKGFATEIGGRTSHSAIMARSLEIPAIVGISGIMEAKQGETIILDAVNGNVILSPDANEITDYTARAVEYHAYVESLKTLKDAKSVSLDGKEVEISANIGTPKDVEAVLANGGEGVGLYRTEFLYMDASALPTEEEQYVAYKAVLEQMNPRRVVVRTLDIGGDKNLSYLQFDHEMNPFLGYRALRLCLDRTDIFRTQLRALLRASVHGKLAIMFPMVATLNEFRQAKAIVEEEKKNLTREGHAIADGIELGTMVEIPAVAALADQFAKECDFFSIGTNDLIQYSMAADRMNQKVAYLYQPYNPSLLRLIKMTIDGAHKEGKWCGMCGEMAGEPKAVALLLGLGLDEFSMSASSMLAARKMIRELSYDKMKDIAEQALNCATQEEVLELLDTVIE